MLRERIMMFHEVLDFEEMRLLMMARPRVADVPPARAREGIEMIEMIGRYFVRVCVCETKAKILSGYEVYLNVPVPFLRLTS